MSFVAVLLFSLNLIASPYQEVHHDVINAETYIFEPTGSEPYLNLIWNAEDYLGIPTNVLTSLLYQESHFRRDIITCHKLGKYGERGIAQLHPKYHTVNGCDPEVAILYAAGYLAKLAKRYHNDWSLALAAYNWGLGNVDKFLDGRKGMPVSVQKYTTDILLNAGMVLT